MSGLVELVNVRGSRGKNLWGDGFVYCGRKCGGFEASIFGNKFREGSREENIYNYKIWLWNEVRWEDSNLFLKLEELVNRVMRGEKVVLGCWCVPLDCHTMVIRDYILWRVKCKS